MKNLFTLLFMLTFFSSSQFQLDSNSGTIAQERILSKNKFLSSQDFLSLEEWKIISNDSISRSAMVSALGEAPGGQVQTVLKLQCPTIKNSVISFEYVVSVKNKIPDFNFDFFEGPGAPALKKKLVEIQVKSPQENLYWKYSVAGWYSNLAGLDSEMGFYFSPSTNNKPDKTALIARMIAKGGAEVTVTVHDNQDNQKIIKTKFPAISPTSEVAKVLDGCRK